MRASPAISNTRRVLLVDDETRLRDMLVRAIDQMGFEATGVNSAEAAARLLAEREFHILILDLNLPGIGGMEFFEELRRDDPFIQVIILTGFGELEAAQRAIHLDAVEFLTKPCPLGELELALDRARVRLEKLAQPPQLIDRAAPPQLQATPTGEPTSLELVERNHIIAVLKKNGGNRTATAAELGISLRKLYYRLGEYQRQGLIQ